VPPTTPADSLRSRVLRWLSDLEQRRAGYELRAARGFAHHTDISKALNCPLQDELASLATRGYLDRENLALPGRALGLWLYRISEKGAASIDAPAPSPLGPPPDREKKRFILTDRQWAALIYMRAAKDQALPLRFVTRERGWRTIKEIRAGASSRRDEIDVWADDVHALARNKLLDKRNESGVARERPLTFYRISPLGEVIERLQWH